MVKLLLIQTESKDLYQLFILFILFINTSIVSVSDTDDCEVLTSDRASKCDGESICNCKGDYCLAGGNCNSGDIYIRGKPVADTNWDFTDADVICRQIGFSGAKKHTLNRK